MVLLVVNKLFQLYVAVFFLSKHRVWDQKTHAVSQDDWSPGKAMLQAVFCAFIPQLFTSEIPRYSFRASIAIKGRRKALLVFLFSHLLLFGDCLGFSFHPAWLSTRKKKCRDIWAMIRLSGSMFCQSQGQKNWSRQDPLSPHNLDSYWASQI